MCVSLLSYLGFNSLSRLTTAASCGSGCRPATDFSQVAVAASFTSAAFQNAAAGWLLIVASVLIGRSSSASRSGLKSHQNICNGIPVSGDRSVTAGEVQLRCVNFMPWSGSRSETAV